MRDTGKASGETEESHWDTEEPSEDGSGAARVLCCPSMNTPEGRRDYFEELKTHPEWGPFFSEVQEVVVGEKIAEGGQAEIYVAEVTFKDGRKFKDSKQYGIRSEQYCNSEFIVKVMKDGCALQDLQRQWPKGMLLAHSRGQRLRGPLKFLSGGTLLKNEELNYRFAFVMDRLWGDLKKLIDLRMDHNNNQGPPFHIHQVKGIIRDIARDLRALQKNEITHKDIKASNVLIFRDKIDDVKSYTGRFRALLVDWECSEGVVGTGFWRAPEILRQMKDNVRCPKSVFTKESDVYSFAMMCYEMVTGRIPFEGHPASDYDIVLDGYRPKLPNDLDVGLASLIRRCWHADPAKRLSVNGVVPFILGTSYQMKQEISNFPVKQIDGMKHEFHRSTYVLNKCFRNPWYRTIL